MIQSKANFRIVQNESGWYEIVWTGPGGKFKSGKMYPDKDKAKALALKCGGVESEDRQLQS